MKKSIVAISLLAFSVTAAIAANRAPIKQPSPAYKKLQLALKQETRNYLRGDGMVEKAYLYLSGEKSKEHIIKENDGVAVANAFKYLLDLHKNGNVIADGSELVGGREDLENNPVAKAADCKWYQFWCLVENFANWVVQNWETIYQIIVVILTGI